MPKPRKNASQTARWETYMIAVDGEIHNTYAPTLDDAFDFVRRMYPKHDLEFIGIFHATNEQQEEK